MTHPIDIPSGVVEAMAIACVKDAFPYIAWDDLDILAKQAWLGAARECLGKTLLAFPSLAGILQGTHVAVPIMQRVRHKRRGTAYVVLGEAELQAEFEIGEGCLLTVYQGDDEKLWARPIEEFADGRFEVISAAQEGDKT